MRKYLSKSVKFRMDSDKHRNALEYLSLRRKEAGESYASIIAALVEEGVSLPKEIDDAKERIIDRIDELEDHLTKN